MRQKKQESAVVRDKQKVIRLPEVKDRIGMSKPSIYRLMKLGKFPQAKRLGERSVGWFESEIDEWLDSRLLSTETEMA